MPSFKHKQALPFRLSYLDTDQLMERLREIYQSEDKFSLVLSNDRLFLYAAVKLTKKQINALLEDPSVYTHYEVPGNDYYVGECSA